MADSQNPEQNDNIPFSRRDVLKTAGGAGALGVFGLETAAAKKSKRTIVGMKPGMADQAKRRADKVDKVIDFGDIGQAVVGHWPEKALKGLQNNPHVEYIEEESTGHTTQETLPWGVDRVDAEVAHTNGDTASGSDIGIVDTGIDLDHPDLVGNLADPNDSSEHSAFVNCNDSSHPDGNCEEDWDDDDSHGTHVAGIAGAVDNMEDVIGVATEATLHAIKVCDDSGSCPCGDVADGIRDAADNGYDVANVSIGGCGGSTMENAVDYAVSNGTIVVASAGNAGPCTDCVSAPGSFDNSIAVSSTTDTDTLSGFSSQGPEVDIAAPGGSPANQGDPHPGRAINSTWNDGGTGVKWGTSMAAPHVTGAIAQLRANGVSQSNVRTVLENTADDIGLTDNEQGWGLLDVAEALGYGSANDLLGVETDFADDLEFTEATLNGTLVELTGSASAIVGFEWGKQGTGMPNTVTASGSPLTTFGSFEATLTGLEEDTTYEFRAKATNAEGSTEFGAVETFSTVDNLDPIADITHSPTEPNPGQTVTFDGSGSFDGDGAGDSIVSYEWDLDDDSAFDDATGVTASRSYSTGGNKTVGLRVTDEFDQTDTTTHGFYVNMAPTASFTVSPDPVVRNEAATFDAAGSSDPDGTVDTYEWDWDYDGTFSVDKTTSSDTTTHTFTTGGEHTVALRVTDDDGATSDPVTKTFTVHIRVAVDISPNGTGPNSINPNRRGNVTVAVLHTPAFDPPARMDHSTVHFGDPDDVGFDTSENPEGGATPTHSGGHIEDIDDDGDMDSVFHFPIQDANFEQDDTEGELVGLTNDGIPVFGSDSVNIVGGGGS